MPAIFVRRRVPASVSGRPLASSAVAAWGERGIGGSGAVIAAAAAVTDGVKAGSPDGVSSAVALTGAAAASGSGFAIRR